jgi:hypothetical protein
MRAIVHADDVQDRDGGALLMATLFGAFPFLTRSSSMAPIRDRNSRAQSDVSLMRRFSWRRSSPSWPI